MVDFNLKEGPATINSDVECLLQQVDILFDSTPGDLLGDVQYGTEYNKYLYNLKLSPDQLKDAIEQDLYSLDLLGFVPSVQVYLLQGSERDIALIQIDLYKQGESYTRTYTIR